jgi:hypothetical protein
MTTPARVNKALKKAGLAVTMYRSPVGYYYFSDKTTAIPSIYSHNLSSYSTQDIVDHVRTSVEQ